MDGLRAWFPVAVSVFVLIGCIMMLAEMMISGHDRGEAQIGIIFAGIGVIVAAVSAVTSCCGSGSRTGPVRSSWPPGCYSSSGGRADQVGAQVDSGC